MRTVLSSARKKRGVRRFVLLFAIVGAAFVLASGVALAANTINCRAGVECKGTRYADAITGTAGDDTIYALAGNDEISDGKGADRIYPGRGMDTIRGGYGRDVYRFNDGWGRDAIVSEASGQDNVNFVGVTNGVTVALDDRQSGIPRGASSGQNTLTLAGNFIEDASGGSGDDSIIGTPSSNSLKGHDGNDSLSGTGGDDVLAGGNGDDSLFGGPGSDSYFGFFGTSGDDTIDDAGGSNDLLLRSGHFSTNVSAFTPLDGPDADNNFEDLMVNFGNGNTVLIKNYFDNSSSRISTIGPGRGLIETIRFSEGDLGFSQIKDLILEANGDDASTNEDTPVAIPVLSNDSGRNLSVKAGSVSDPANGTAEIISGGSDDGKVLYTPDANYNNTSSNPDSFTYEACTDGNPTTCDRANVNVTVNPVNDRPSFTAQGDQMVDEDSGTQTVSGWASNFDPGAANESGQQVAGYTVTDASGDSVNSSLFTSGGQPEVSDAGDLTYTPAPNANGTAALEVRVRDDGGTANGGQDTSDPQNLNITINPLNDAPRVSLSGDDTMNEGDTSTYSFAVTDDDVGDDYTVNSGFPDCGTGGDLVSGSFDGPASGDTTFQCHFADGPASPDVKVQVNDGDADSNVATRNVTVANLDPVISSVTNDGPKDEGSSVSITATASDPAGGQDPLTYRFDCNGDGDYGDAGDSGPQSANTADCIFQEGGNKTVNVRVEDGDGGSDTGSTTVTVNRVNDKPVANNGALSMDEDAAPITIDLGNYASDTETADADLTYNIVSGPTAEQGELTGAGATRTFDSADNFNGTVEIVYTVTDRGDPDGCTPGPDCAAAKTSDQGTLTITVNPVNDNPDAVNDDATTDEDTNKVIDVLSNDSFAPDTGEALSVQSVGDSPNGTVSKITSGPDAGKVLYTPDADYNNTSSNPDSFTYTLSDGNGGTDTATVNVTVNPVNDAPVADDESFSGTSSAVGNTALVVNSSGDGAPDPNGPQKTVSGDILAGDTDVDGPGPLIVQAGTFATNDGGSVNIESDGDFTYYPKAGTSCTDPQDFFDYTVTDQNPGTPGTDTGRVNLTISDCVWYVDGSAASNGDGRSNSPFNSLAGINGTGGADAANQKIFLYGGTYSGGLTLENNQTLYSQRHGLTVSDGGSGTVTLEPAVPAGPNTQINGGLVLASGNTIQGVDLGNASGAALSGSSVGTATMNTQTSGAINNTSGKAVDISGGTLNMAFTGVSSNNSTTQGIRLDNTTGTFNASGGAIQNATDRDVDISGDRVGADNVDFTYDGLITDDLGALVNVSGQTGGTKDINGAISDGNDGDGGGISLTNNTGATVRFDGGLVLSTGANPAFSATGGGTVNVTGANNTTATTTGTALNVSNTTIGSNGLTFKSISAGAGTSAGSGPANGIVLNNTGSSGGLTVTGDGTNTALGGNSSGGTISNATGADGGVAGSAIYLNNTSSVTLRRMTINGTNQNFGIYGTSVTGSTLEYSTISGSNGTSTANDEASVAFTNLTGSASLTNDNISGGVEDDVRIQNSTGSLSSLSITGSTFATTGANTANDGLSLIGDTGASVFNATVTGNSFTRAQGDLFQYTLKTGTGTLNFNSNTVTNNFPTTLPAGGGDINISSGSLGNNPSLTYTISNNQIYASGTGGQPPNGSVIVAAATPQGSATGTISNNTIGTTGVTQSGGFDAILADAVKAGSHKVTITGNTIRRYKEAGIRLLGVSPAAAPGFNMRATVKGNVITEPDSIAFAGIDAEVGADPSDIGTMCLDLGGTTAGDKNSVSNGDPTNFNDINLIQQFNTSMNLPGYTGSATDDSAVATFVAGRNNGDGTPTVSAIHDTTTADGNPAGSGFTGTGTNCS